MKASYLSWAVFGSMLIATVLLSGCSREPGKPSAPEPVSKVQVSVGPVANLPVAASDMAGLQR